MTARTLLTAMTLAAVVLAVAAVLPTGAPRASFGLAVVVGALLYLAAGLVVPRPGRPVAVVIGVRAGPVAGCWVWGAPVGRGW